MRNALLLLLFCSSFNLYAQNNTVASGGQANGSGGTSSYSVGQINYSSYTGSSGSVTQGVQQPYEISVVTSIKNIAIDLKAQIYPNPTTDKLILSINTQCKYP